jgi:hypothetical protein
LMGLAAAVVGSAVIGGVVTSSAASKAAKVSQNATDQTTQLAQQQFQQTRSDNEPFRQAGMAAINPLMAQLGIGGGQGGPTASRNPLSGPAGSSPQEAFDWAGYRANNPDVNAAVTADGSGFNGSTPDERAADQYARYGRGEGRMVSTIQPAQPVLIAPTAPSAPVNPFIVDPSTGGVTATRPDAGPRPTVAPRPEMTRPTTAPFSFTAEQYQETPGYQYRQSEARKGILASAGATGAMQSGAALKELYDRGDQIANQDFTSERAVNYGQYMDAANRSDANFTSDRAFGENVYTGDRSYGDQIYNMDRGFNADIFNSDRGYATDTFNNRTNQLFNLAGVGTGVNNANASAGNTATGLQTNALFSNAATQGNAALTQASSFNNVLSAGVNAYAYGKNGGGAYGTPSNPASSFSGMAGGTANPLLARGF